jgi:serine/threonine protein kinase/tetratricopeptide (TPR) repeat protein
MNQNNGEQPSTDSHRDSVPSSPIDPATMPLKGKRGPKERIPHLPREGHILFGFRMRHELGRGAFACVFLAEQEALAGRPVVLKISSIDGDEPQTLAQLQHTHIVPIYSVHEDPQLGLRAVCMPYFGGASLSCVLQQLWTETTRPTEGAQLVRALEAIANVPVLHTSPINTFGPDTPALTDPSPREMLARMGYTQAAVWIVARLAEALQHAHSRGVIHRDIKPSNVLLGADGQPMLLDFNVAKNLRREQAEARATVGGTIAYMAPEHLRAMTGQGPINEVDQRADLYSLGIVLFEVMTGCKPFAQTASYSPVLTEMTIMALERSRVQPSLREKRPDVPWSLESIFRKCMAPDRAERYQHAEHLAEDLRRFLDDRPLKYAPELSKTEQVRKWLRRHPRLTSSGAVALAASLILVAGGAAFVGVQRHLATATEELQTARAVECKRDYEQGTVRALCLVNMTTDIEDHLRQGIEVCEKTLALFGVLDRDDWQRRPEWVRLDAEDRQRLAEETRELLMSLAWARVRSHAGDHDELHQALALLDRAEAVEGLGPSRALLEDRASYLEQLGDIPEALSARAAAAETPATTARDHYLLATSYARAHQYDKAIAELNESLHLNPRSYWATVERGLCQLELGRYTLAVADYSTSIGLWPEFAWGYFNRAYVLEKSGNRLEALADYTAALKRDPDFVAAYLNRGMLRLELRQYAAALEDLDEAARRGRDDAYLHGGRGVALEGMKRHEEADEEFKVAFAHAKDGPDEARIRLSWVYGFAVSSRLPARAREAFDNVLQAQPQYPQALYGRAMLLVEEGREREAIDCFSRALQGTPSFADARRYRAILWARAGRFEEASKDVEWCLEREPNAGSANYAAACVAALYAEKSKNPEAVQQAAGQALEFLKRAFAAGYGREQAAKDPDLKGIQAHPGFLELMKDCPGP